MGKEAKIGLGVIMILLITFGVVLAKKLGGSDDATDASLAAQNDRNMGRVEPGSNLGEANGRTLVPTAAASSGVAEHPPGEESAYPAAADYRATIQQVDAGGAGNSASSLFPSTPAPKVASLYDAPSQTAQSTSVPAATANAHTGNWGSAGGGYGQDPFRQQTAQTSVTTVPLGQRANVLRMPLSPGQSPQQRDMSSYPYEGTGSYQGTGSHQGTGAHAAGSAAGPQVPADLQRSRQTYATPSLSPETAQQTAIPGHPAELGAQYATEDLRHQDGRYEVRPNDNYWAISKNLYGSGAYFKALAEHNRQKIPQEDRLIVGDLISAPSLSELEKSYPGLCPRPSRREAVRTRATAVSTRSGYATGRTYAVEEGDTLFDIARYELGKASRWVEIYELNRDLLGKDFDYITPGTRLTLPENRPQGESSSAVNRHPGTGSIY